MMKIKSVRGRKLTKKSARNSDILIRSGKWKKEMFNKANYQVPIDSKKPQIKQYRADSSKKKTHSR